MSIKVVDENDESYLNVLESDYKSDLAPGKIALKMVKNGSSVLSAGCGRGREVRFLVRELGCKVTAIDISKDNIAKSKEHEPRAKYFLADMSSFRSNEKFDFIVCIWNTINFLPGKNARRNFIKNCHYNLKDGGKLILTTGHVFSHWRTLAKRILNPLNDYYYFPLQIKYWFNGSKFKVERVKINETILILATKIK